MILHVALLLVSLAAQDGVDPEATPDGRDEYLGRSVARTMHWTGAPWLLRETREDEENGLALRRWLDVQSGDAICDLGCGNGYHTLPLAEAVGPDGRVFAVDLQPEMLVLLEKRAKEAELDNLTYVEATTDDPGLPPASCDLVLMVDVYHELSHPVRVLGHVRRALKPGGRVVLVEFRAEDRSVPIKTRHKMTKAQVIREMAANGFVLGAETDDLPWQHVMAFEVDPAGDARREARAIANGFLDAMGRLDPRIVEPFFAGRVDVGAETKVSGKELAVDLASVMRSVGAPIPAGTRAELRAGPDGSVIARLEAPAGGAVFADRDELVLAAGRDGAWGVEAWRPARSTDRAHGSARPFVAMDTGTAPGTPAEQGALTCELGFDGIGWGTARVADVRAACEKGGGDVWSVYHVLDVADPAGSGVDELRGAMSALVGGPAMVWLGLRSAGAEARDPARDAAAAAVLAPLLEHADATGIEIALYPHTGLWMETTEDALRIADEVDHARLGVCFNLCHFLRTQGAADAGPMLRSAGPRLFAVTVNGADVDGENWATLIQPLGAGDHDLRALLDVLDEIDFRGPVGLQAYGLRAAPREHLTESMRAWRAAHGR